MIKGITTMISNAMIEPGTWPPTATSAFSSPGFGAQADPTSPAAIDAEDRILQMADFSRHDSSAREKIHSMLPQMLENPAHCPVDEVDRKLEACITQIRRALPKHSDITGWGRLEEELKWVIQVLAETIARKITDQETRRILEESKEAEATLAKCHEEIERLTARLRRDSEYLDAESELIGGHEEIIGKSEAIRRVLREVERVAVADCSVLIHTSLNRAT